MKFFQPLIQLVRETGQGQPDDYFLHIVTFSPNTRFRAESHDTDDSDLQSDGLLKVNVYLKQDTSLPDFDFITPVVHTLELGNIAFPGGGGAIRTQAFYRLFEPVDELKSGGAAQVETADAEVKNR
jgi:hypothetical protein